MWAGGTLVPPLLFRHGSATDARDSFTYVVHVDNEEARMNVVMLIGNLATDVDVKDLGDDKRVANFLLAVDRRTKDGGADFFRVRSEERRVGKERRDRRWPDGSRERATRLPRA